MQTKKARENDVNADLTRKLVDELLKYERKYNLLKKRLINQGAR